MAGTGNATEPAMWQLSSDGSFHFEILRALSASTYNGADVVEVLTAAKQIEPGNFESFSSAFNLLANKVESRAQAIDKRRFPVSARSAFFIAATYFRSADFYLHNNASDPRINALWASQTTSFNEAIALVEPPAARATIKTPHFDIPTIWYTPSVNHGAHAEAKKEKRPTLIMGNGFDGSQEELYHIMGAAALERGYNVLTYEGPGQPTVRREQGLGFIPDWERVVTPVLDHLLAEHADVVDPAAVGLMGLSFGGYLAPRAAAFEPDRIAAVIVLDGFYDFSEVMFAQLPAQAVALFESGNKTAFDALVPVFLSPETPSNARWGMGHGMWAFGSNGSAFDLLTKVKAYTLADKTVTDRIRMPVFVGDAENDLFSSGQPKKLADAIGDNAVLHSFTEADLIGEHGGIGSAKQQNQVVLDWFQNVLDEGKNGSCTGGSGSKAEKA